MVLPAEPYDPLQINCKSRTAIVVASKIVDIIIDSFAHAILVKKVDKRCKKLYPKYIKELANLGISPGLFGPDKDASIKALQDSKVKTIKGHLDIMSGD